MSVLLVMLSIILTGCVGIVDDYAKTAIGLGENATGNTVRTLAQKHDLEAAAYAAAYCGQPRIGAVERRYADPVHLHARLSICEIERQIGF